MNKYTAVKEMIVAGNAVYPGDEIEVYKLKKPFKMNGKKYHYSLKAPGKYNSPNDNNNDYRTKKSLKENIVPLKQYNPSFKSGLKKIIFILAMTIVQEYFKDKQKRMQEQIESKNKFNKIMEDLKNAK